MYLYMIGAVCLSRKMITFSSCVLEVGFMVPGWFFMVPGWFFMVPGGFSWFFMVPGWVFMVFHGSRSFFHDSR